MDKKLRSLTLYDAVKGYIVYLHALKLPLQLHAAYIRGLRHIIRFYGYQCPLDSFDGKRVLQYADIYDPFSFDPIHKERGQVFWKFVHYLKKNELIPAWTAPENGDVSP